MPDDPSDEAVDWDDNDPFATMAREREEGWFD